jgi:Adenylate and Guanylate cyclase catalytic domain
MSVLTFLFTDIEGSTRRWEADAAAMRVALETHNQVLRDAVDANDGRVFNYTGDGMCAVFTSPRSAVDAAVAAQLALELPVRMGIATGEAELRGGDYFGTVHLREVLSDETYASLARRGAAMTNPAMAKFALEQIDRVRTELTSTAGD